MIGGTFDNTLIFIDKRVWIKLIKIRSLTFWKKV